MSYRSDSPNKGGLSGYVVDCYTKNVCRVLKNSYVYDYETTAKTHIPSGYCYLIDKEHDYFSGWLTRSKTEGIVHLKDEDVKVEKYMHKYDK